MTICLHLLHYRMPALRGAQGLLLTTYMKLLVADPGDTALRDLVAAVFDRYARCGRGAELAEGPKQTGSALLLALLLVVCSRWCPGRALRVAGPCHRI